MNSSERSIIPRAAASKAVSRHCCSHRAFHSTISSFVNIFGWDGRTRTYKGFRHTINSRARYHYALHPKTYAFVKPALQNPQGQPTA